MHDNQQCVQVHPCSPGVGDSLWCGQVHVRSAGMHNSLRPEPIQVCCFAGVRDDLRPPDRVQQALGGQPTDEAAGVRSGPQSAVPPQQLPHREGLRGG